MQNATFLTQKYPGEDFWTSCIHDFLCRCKPDLPVSACIRTPSASGPWYESRQQSPILRIDDSEILKEPGPNKFLSKIGSVFGMNLMDDPGRCTTKGCITGIAPDIVLIRPGKQGVCIIENKPYYESGFGGNQAPPDGAYIDFVLWLNGEKGVPTEYMVMHSCSWKKDYPKVKQLQDVLQGHFGSLLLEDIFLQMARHKFVYPPIAECWEDFADKRGDFA